MRIKFVIYSVVGLFLSSCVKCNRDAPTAVVSETNDSALPAATSSDVQPWEREDVKAAIAANAFKSFELQPGSGEAVTTGKTVSVHYTGWLTNGTMFDSSRTRGEPFSFSLGGGQVIAGWDQGVNGMRRGERKLLVIPADMGYGPAGAGGVIPPDSILIFEVEMIDFQ